MKITKYGHCCLLIEEKGVRILTDPGAFTTGTHAALTGIDVILYTHEHADHYHLDSLKQLLVTNPAAAIICNEGVSALIEKERITHTKLTGGTLEQKGVAITGVSGLHAEIHSTIPRIQNTGFLIGGTLWYPGDAFINPNVSFDVLALPFAGPWMKLSEAIDYAIALKPNIAFPVHDWILSEAGQSVSVRVAGGILAGQSIELKTLELGKEYKF